MYSVKNDSFYYDNIQKKSYLSVVQLDLLRRSEVSFMAIWCNSRAKARVNLEKSNSFYLINHVLVLLKYLDLSIALSKIRL